MVSLRSHPHLYQINTWPWLDRLSRHAGRTITLADVPDEHWDRLRDSGFDLVYLLGIWQRSPIGREIARATPSLFPSYEAALPLWRPRDVVGSAFSIAAYEPDARIGTFDDLDAVREKLHARGMRLIVDFVPNHLGFDHRWIDEHPDRFVTAPEDRHRGEPDAFRRVEGTDGQVRFIACARDPNFPPWTDVAQLDYSKPGVRAAMIDVLRSIAEHADGARCDMAMLVLSDVFRRTWSHLAGPVPPEEFWGTAAEALPRFLLLAEVYWNLEARLQHLGFSFTYDKTLYDRLRAGSAPDVRAHLTADLSYQRRMARFIENHDEPRSSDAFGPRVTAAAVAIATLPGLRFFGDGQLEGRRVRVPVQLGAVADEPVDAALADFYRRLLEISNDPIFHAGEWQLSDIVPIDGSSSQVLAWQWRATRGECRLVVVNLGASTAQARVDVRGDLPQGDRIAFEDRLNGQLYERGRSELAADGLYVRLDAGGAHVFAWRPMI